MKFTVKKGPEPVKGAGPFYIWQQTALTISSERVVPESAAVFAGAWPDFLRDNAHCALRLHKGDGT